MNFYTLLRNIIVTILIFLLCELQPKLFHVALYSASNINNFVFRVLVLMTSNIYLTANMHLVFQA
jgi:hypothetical protein